MSESDKLVGRGKGSVKTKLQIHDGVNSLDTSKTIDKKNCRYYLLSVIIFLCHIPEYCH